MLRAAALCLLIFVSFAVTLPLADSLAQSLNDKPAATRSGKRRYRRHSHAWWRRYRARIARRRAAQARERALAAMRGEKSGAVEGFDSSTASNAVAATGGVYNDPQGQWSVQLPRGWSNRPQVRNGEMQFRVFERDGKGRGQVQLSYVTPAGQASDAELSARARRLTYAGVPFADLRRTVIDRMINAQGFVTNDMVREIGGRRVYIVTAQSAASADGRTPEQHWTFYFTEIQGRIYSLGVAASRDAVERLDAEAQQVLSSIRTGNR